VVGSKLIRGILAKAWWGKGEEVDSWGKKKGGNVGSP